MQTRRFCATRGQWNPTQLTDYLILHLRRYNHIEIHGFVMNVHPEVFPIFLGSYGRTAHAMSTSTYIYTFIIYTYEN